MDTTSKDNRYDVLKKACQLAQDGGAAAVHHIKRMLIMHPKKTQIEQIEQASC